MHGAFRLWRTVWYAFSMTLSALLMAATQRLVAAGIPADEVRAEVRILALHAFGLTREQLFLHMNSPIIGGQGGEGSQGNFDALIARRASREPLAYIIGEREFYGLTFKVTPAVLIPRPETEHLVENIPFPSTAGRGHFLDLGTGSGCLAVTLAKLHPDTEVWATDLSVAALEVARENAARHGVSVHFRQGDLLAPLPPELCFAVIVSNPPYIAHTEAPSLAPEVMDFEPSLALFGTDDDGLGFYRRLATEAVPRLLPGGRLLVEVGAGQADAVAQLWRQAGLEGVTIVPDLAGIGRVVMGQSGSCAPGK